MIHAAASTDTDCAPRPENYLYRNRKIIVFISLALCLAGAYAAWKMPASVFPTTDFPRIVVLIDNGVMPADEMMATITRPVEEVMKSTPGTVNIRSATGRGSAEVNVFFDWGTNMVEAELYVLGRMAQIRADLPPTAQYTVNRLAFTSFPMVGISLTGSQRSISDLWETAEYTIKPQLLRTRGVSRVELVGGKVPEYHVNVDAVRLDTHHLTLAQVSAALTATNMFQSAGMHEEDRQLYLTLVDGRVKTAEEIGKIPVAWSGNAPIRVEDVATVTRDAAPSYNIVSADGQDAVLLNVYSQPDGNTIAIADELKAELEQLQGSLPKDLRLAFFYDESLFVRDGARSVWESIAFGLLLSVSVLYLFLRSFSTTLVAILAIPACLLITIAGMHALGMSFNLMTLGGIAAAIGLIIDDAIVVVEALHSKLSAGQSLRDSTHLVIREVGPALVGSTITPVAVFIPLAFLDGVPGVFFRALALTMAAALLLSLLLAVTLTPALGLFLLRTHPGTAQDEQEQGGPMLRRLINLYERVVRASIHRPFLTTMCLVGAIAGGFAVYRQLESDFLPHLDEGAFVLDYVSPPGTSLTETDRMLRHVEALLRDVPEVESYSRRTGAQLGLAITEPNTGDILVKLRPDRKVATDDVVDEIRSAVESAEPALEIEFVGILSDLIGDLTWSPEPVEIKLFSEDVNTLQRLAPEIADTISNLPGVVDVNDGLVVAGPSLVFKVAPQGAARAGFTTQTIGSAMETAMLGTTSSYVLEGDRVVDVRVLLNDPDKLDTRAIGLLPLRSDTGARVTVGDVATPVVEAGQLEMHREDQRQLVAVSGRLSGVDLSHGIASIKKAVAEKVQVPDNVTIEYGGLFEQQQASFANLLRVLAMAIVLVFAVLVYEFRSFTHPLAIVTGALLSLTGVAGALWLTGVSLNIVSFLGAIIGFGIVAKNGILMLDFVEQLRRRGLSLEEALVQSGRRRLRPVLMTSLTAFLGLLPLAYGVGTGADMLRPLAIGVIGALCISLALSLVATPAIYYALAGFSGHRRSTT